MTSSNPMDPVKRKRHIGSPEPADPESVSSSPVNDAGPGIAPEMSAMVNLLASSVQGMQGSLGNAYQSMANQLKQSMEMTHTMSNMMELFLVSSLNICSRIERDEQLGKPVLTLTTENKSQFPIPGVTGTLRIGRINDENNTFVQCFDSSANMKSSTLITTKRGAKEVTKKEYSIYQTRGEAVVGMKEDKPPTNTSLDVLLPGSKLVDVFTLDLGSFDEWVIHVEASFKSPGTGKSLFKRHECCVYLIDQCKIDWSPYDMIPRDKDEYSVQPKMMIKAFREILQVPVADGIKVGMRFMLDPPGVSSSVCGSIIDLLDDRQSVQLDLWKDGSDESIDLDRIDSELTVLGGVHS